MFLILSNDRGDFWSQAEDTEAYDSMEEAEEVGKELELFDCIIVEFKKFI